MGIFDKFKKKQVSFNGCLLGGTNKYYNHVAWCPFCDQGWVDIVKDIKTGALFCSCTECGTEWDEPSAIKNSKVTHNKYGMITHPNEEEIDNVGWKKYIIKMNLNDFCKILIKIFPDKKEKLLNHKKENGKILGHVLFGDEVAEILYKLLIENKNVDLIKMYIEFIELMYAQGDDDVLNILDVTILERLSNSTKVWNRLSKYISNSLKEYINNDLLVNNIMMSHITKLK